VKKIVVKCCLISLLMLLINSLEESEMPAPKQNPIQSVYSKLIDLGFSPSAAAGLMANIDVETGGTFNPSQRQLRGPGRGLFQLDPSGPLPRVYQQYLTNTGKTDTMDSQLEFMRDTIYGDTKLQKVIGEGNTKRLRKVFEEGSPERVAKEFQDIWERPRTPHEERRIESARRFKEIYVEPEQEFNLLYIPDYQQPQPMSVPRRRPSLASDLVDQGRIQIPELEGAYDSSQLSSLASDPIERQRTFDDVLRDLNVAVGRLGGRI
jgi:hypothetical protein